MSLLAAITLGTGLALTPPGPAVELAQLPALVRDVEARRQARRAERQLYRAQCRQEVASSGLRGPARAFAVRQCVLGRTGRLR
jgi:hypothetical protein